MAADGMNAAAFDPQREARDRVYALTQLLQRAEGGVLERALLPIAAKVLINAPAFALRDVVMMAGTERDLRELIETLQPLAIEALQRF
jgi:hypothetical protein